MEKKKRQRIKDGAVVKINLSENRLIFGRLIVGRIGIYDFVVPQSEQLPEIEVIISKPTFLYCSVYNDVITKGVFEIIGFKELTKDEIDKIPAKFMQDLVNIDDCVIFWPDGRERRATPQECIDLERSSVWEAEGLVQRIEDHYAGKRNFHVELDKVILSKDDLRYMPPPQALRWDFEKQEFYRTDK
jgi:hypothetical protein